MPPPPPTICLCPKPWNEPVTMSSYTAKGLPGEGHSHDIILDYLDGPNETIKLLKIER